MTRIIISGGGTGGHIFPAIAIANALKLMDPDIDILFIGAKGRMEMEKVPAAGYPIRGLWISGLQRRLTLKNLSFPFKVISSLVKADRILARFRPDAVIGVGGYASGPTLRAATRRKIPTLIQEQNSYPGITNKLLGSRVNRICVAYEGMDRFFPASKIILTGNPVRQDIVTPGSRSEALEHFQLESGIPVVLIIGGSLGAGTINKSVRSYLDRHSDTDSLQLLWQTGKTHFTAFTSDPKITGKKGVHIYPFIDRMDLAYAAADIIVSRAGAIAISELCIIGKPVILIPSPNVAEDHQTKNASALESRSAAILLKDADAEEKLFILLHDLIANPEQQHTMSSNIKILGLPEAASDIAGETMKLIQRKA